MGGSSQGPVALTLLFTTDEHGWLLPDDEAGRSVGGASQLYAQLTAKEHHCAGAATEPAVDGASRLPPPDRCADSHSLLLSGGDSFTGPALSSYFRGASMAQAMARLGYAASALGNHELDFERAAFEANRQRSGVRYVAANAVRTDGTPSTLAEPFVLVRRAGIKVGVIGIATIDTPQTAVASRFAAIRFDDVEASLERVVPRVREAGADVVVVLAHECAAKVIPVLERHPEWRLSFVGTGHCHEPVEQRVGEVPVLSPGWRLDRYARVRLEVGPSTTGPRAWRVTEWGLVDVRSAGRDAVLDRWIAGWQAEVDQALGEVVAYSGSGLPRESPQLADWVLRSWLEALDADVALTTAGSLRQDLRPGPVNLAAIHSILPFENELVVATVPGALLREMAGRPTTRTAGLSRRPDGQLAMANGQRFDDRQRYRVVTTDFLYGGGDDCPFRTADPKARFTGVHWREPVIRWTRSLGTSPARPLEQVLRGSRGSLAPPVAP